MKRSHKITVEDLFQIVWAEHWSTVRYQMSGHAVQVRRNYKKHVFETFGSKKLCDVEAVQVRKWHSSLVEVPYMANRSLEVLSRLFTFAIDAGIINTANPCSPVKHHTERKRRRFATEPELKKIGEILLQKKEAWPRQVAFMFTLLYTGARPRSIERAKWEDVSLLADDMGLLTFEGKSTAETGEEETVILPPLIMGLIKALPRRHDGRIFGIKLPKDFWNAVREDAGCPDLWARDLRRTFATVGMSNGVKMDTISELLNHKSVQTTKIYAKLSDNARVKAANDITGKITSILSGTKAVNE